MRDAATEHLNALDRAARHYREALKHVIEECGNDTPRIDHIRDAATRGLRAADHELERGYHKCVPRAVWSPAEQKVER